MLDVLDRRHVTRHIRLQSEGRFAVSLAEKRGQPPFPDASPVGACEGKAIKRFHLALSIVDVEAIYLA